MYPEDGVPWNDPAEFLLEPPIIWFDDVGTRNALTPKGLDDLAMNIACLLKDDRPIVIAGRGPAFCSGFDLKLCRDDPGALAELLHRLHHVISLLKSASVPVVIAAHGAAVAGACAFFGGADYVVTDANAKLGYPVVRIGLSPAVSAPFLSHQVAASTMRRLMLDASLIDGRQAFECGLVHECVATPEEVLAAAMAAARNLASKPRDAFAATKKLLLEIEASQQDSVASPPSQGWPSRGLAISLASADTNETRTCLAALSFK
jgi:enoyl-CoA hydratase/carnithine racemase